MNLQHNPHLQALFNDWKDAKYQEGQAIHKRRQIEKAIKVFLQSLKAWPEDKTQTLFKVKIDATHQRQWNQPILSVLANSIPEALFPFSVRWSESRVASRYLEHNQKEIWSQLKPALTILPRQQPCFTLLKDYCDETL